MAKGAQTRARSVQRFLDAGLEVFGQFGYQASSIEQICERASMSRGAFYSNFSDKETLFLALFDRHADRMLARTAAAVDTELTIEGVVRTLFGVGTETKQEERQWFLLSAEFSIQASRNPVAAKRLADHDRAVVEKLSKILSSTLCSAEEQDDPRIQLLARLALAIYEGGMMQMVAEPRNYAPLELLEFALPALTREWTDRTEKTGRVPSQNFAHK
ncbi:AcrR family transcriptional regulator [Rhodococcus erythropolis]|uniref:TetR/AcrR family transcriptional regulator n=1 Tax=Rhodococcus erythropolis TaxID=1833 RepID=UPI002168AA89|nr:TetR/AcrR family transcriptional regulator [Rhodococcus erythropolis]MCS4255912.1 AcrR family transcriptional regulator [Rhodococcus erythropolis]MCW2425429.1 AcrR family transcriptional regulator [Rhodococcus erythropolis]